MRLNTFHKFKFTAEYWDYTSAQDPLTGKLVNNYYKSRDIRFSLVSAEKGTMYLFAEDQLRYSAQVRNLRDAAGNAVFTSEISGLPEVSYVGVSEPVFDVSGALIGYRHDISQGLAE